MNDRVPSFLLSGNALPVGDAPVRSHKPFIDGALNRIGSVITATYVQWEFASKKGLLQAVDSRVKLVCMLFLVVVATVRNDPTPTLVLSALLFVLALFSRLDLLAFYRRVGLFAFFFGFLAGLPAALNTVTEGRMILPLLTFRQPHEFRFFIVPSTIGITVEGVWVVARLTLRVLNCLSVSLLLLYTTPLPQILRSLKVLRVPDTLLVVLFLTYKYIFIFSTTLEDMYLAMESRLVGPLRGRETGDWTAGRIISLFRRTRTKCEDVYEAMVSRGLTGEVILPGPGPLKAADLCAGIGLVASGGFILWI
jgi:cobalt/nickel transport system permease protein